MKPRFSTSAAMLVLSLLILPACAPKVTTPVKEAEKITEKETVKPEKEKLDLDRVAREIEEEERRRQKAFESAEQAYAEGEPVRAEELFLSFIGDYPEDERVPLAYMRVGKIYVEEGRLDEAAGVYEKVVSEYPGHDLSAEAQYRLALVYFGRGDYNDAVEAFKGLLDLPLDKGRKLSVVTTIADGYYNMEMYFDALSWYMKSLGERPGEDDEKKIKARVVKIVDEKLAPWELEEVVDAFGGTFAADYAHYHLIKLLVEEESYEEAKREVEKLVTRTGDEVLKRRAGEILEIIVQRMNVNADTIGCILPLSGRFAPYGRKVLKGIQLAAGVFGNAGGIPVNLVIKDSKGMPAEAVRAVEELVEEDRVVAIIGPLLSGNAEVAAFRAQEMGVPLMALSQKMGIPEIGDYIFRNFLVSRLQTKTLARYAVEELGIRRFAILYPMDYYGEEFMNLFWNDVTLFGGEVVGVRGYEKGKYDFGSEIRDLVGVDKVDRKTGRSRSKSDRLMPIVDFEAVFIPDSYDKAAVIAPQLAYNDVLGVRLLGTNSWNSPKLVKIGGKYVEGAVFVDGFYPDSHYEFARNFTSEFESAFGEKPGVLEAQAYDATKMVVSLIRSGDAKSRVELRDALLSMKNHDGATGRTTVTDVGDVEKNIFVLTVSNGQIMEAQWTTAPEEEEGFKEEELPLIQ